MGKRNQQTTAPTTTDPVADIIAEANESIPQIEIGEVAEPEPPPVVIVGDEARPEVEPPRVYLDEVVEKLRQAATGIRAHGQAVASTLEGPLGLIDSVIAELS
jgi:hypothetical protein